MQFEAFVRRYAESVKHLGITAAYVYDLESEEPRAVLTGPEWDEERSRAGGLLSAALLRRFGKGFAGYSQRLRDYELASMRSVWSAA